MEKKRYVILDALRGFAILGICLANYPEFSLWTFSDQSLWTASDKVTRLGSMPLRLQSVRCG